MDAYKIAHQLDTFAKAKGWRPPERVFIRGTIRCDSSDLYSDEGMDWCEACAERLIKRFGEEFIGPLYEFPIAVTVDPASGDDGAVACAGCGETLDHYLNETGVGEEVAHYTDYQVTDADLINRRQAFELACLVVSAPSNPDVLAIGAAALAAIEAGHIAEED